MGDKRFKDPIYGYIEVEEELINKVIDTASFQRLRNIIQTSYSPLYASALHNRFTHSIGVYHLGRIAAQALEKSCTSAIIHSFPEIKKYLKVFEKACLLHDVGHAPFSHTGEDFYFDDEKHVKFHKIIVELVDDSVLWQEIKKNSYKAAAHELMSVIVGLRLFGGMIEKDKWSFFARCITGYKYTENLTDEKQLMNCLIELLNSSIIDVDKLDYLIRDAYMTGFDTIKIDYLRLLESIRILKRDGEYQICYYKTAISVIENVIYARDAERKWIQNHPAVLYEIYLLQNVMSQIVERYMGQAYIGYEYLTEKGEEIEQVGWVRLISDADIIFLMKNLPYKGLVAEFFDRKSRKHPIWKTEAEYQAIFIGNEEAAEIIECEFSDLKRTLNSLGCSSVINSKALNACQTDMHNAEIAARAGASVDAERDKLVLEKRAIQIKIIKTLESFAKSENILFEFVIISANQFNSGFRKPEFSTIGMIFPELNVPCAFAEVSNVLKASESIGEKFFYLYYTRNSSNTSLRIAHLIGELIQIAYEISAKARAREATSRLE